MYWNRLEMTNILVKKNSYTNHTMIWIRKISTRYILCMKKRTWKLLFYQMEIVPLYFASTFLLFYVFRNHSTNFYINHNLAGINMLSFRWFCYQKSFYGGKSWNRVNFGIHGKWARIYLKDPGINTQFCLWTLIVFSWTNQ